MSVHRFGSPPFAVAVIHGGPGAPGEMKPVAEELSKSIGILEPLQSANSVDGQVEELKSQIEATTNQPVAVVGYSWGAWLGYLFAAKYPQLVRKLILVSSGPFEEGYAKEIMATRLSRLSEDERKRVTIIFRALRTKGSDNQVMRDLGKLMDKADSFDPPNVPHPGSSFQPEIYESVWPAAEELRRNGQLLEAGKSIRCPVVAIHGDYDPHPANGVSEPLSKVLKDFKFVLLKNCGHRPWDEKEAKDKFYQVLRAELKQ